MHIEVRSNPSIERTCPGKPGHASHVKRLAISARHNSEVAVTQNNITPSNADVHAGYQLVGQLMAYEGQIVWIHAGVFSLVLAALLTGAFTTTFPGVTGLKSTAALQLAASILALASTLVWWSMALRSRHYYNYWIAQGRELEKHMPGINVLTQGRCLGRGDVVVVGGDTLKLGPTATYRHSLQFNYLYGVVTVLCVLATVNRACNLSEMF